MNKKSSYELRIKEPGFEEWEETVDDTNDYDEAVKMFNKALNDFSYTNVVVTLVELIGFDEESLSFEKERVVKKAKI